ncbi:SGNH/GDSL hydrolase family protein [uncultured Friedmanniella sp.]|uniref:SGNH/GDSL hydrolase family protein n=1 Tax=uncultured Friedmanniella sp. TaxID=335381 RepID=UPI0035CB3984
MPALPPPSRLTRRALLGAAGAVAVGSLLGCDGPSAPAPASWQQRLRTATPGSPRRIAFLGDSISFGGGPPPGSGSSLPKYRWCYPGQLRAALDTTYGAAGTGWVLMNHALWPVTAANRGWEPRVRVVGRVTKEAAGPFKRACFGIPAGGRRPRSYVEFTAAGSRFTTLVRGQPGGRSRQLVSVDGGALHSLANVAAPAPGLLRSDIPTGSAGRHTIRVWGDVGRCDLVAVSASTGEGLYLVDNVSSSGESLLTFLGPADPALEPLFGLPYVARFAFDLLVVELGTNDYNAGRPLEEVEPEVRLLLDRQRATGGDVVLTFPPVSAPSLHPAGGPTYAEYVDRYAAIASATGTPFLDLSHLWGATFAEADAVRPQKYADHAIHPSDSGAADIAARVRSFLEL